MERTTELDGGSATALTVGVLGSLEVSVAGRPVALTSGRLRALLAALAVSANTPASVDRLADAVWYGDLPDNARHGIQTYVNRLRGVLGPGAIRTCPDGYLLATDQVDMVRFERLLDAAAAAPDPDSERARLDKALALWRGTPFAGVRSVWLEQVEAPRLTERYLCALERCLDLDLVDRCDGGLIARLRKLTGRYPLRERFWAQLMLALYRSGRQAEALDAYQRLYRLLDEELGVEPSRLVRDLHRRLLAGDARLDASAGPLRAGVPVPRQLPAGVVDFTGRAAVLDRLDALVPSADHSVNTVVISAIAGGPGVGKTALAVHWAHRVADRFPDGQLYVNLRGFDPAGAPVQSIEAVRGFLEALGVAPQRIPADPQAQVGLYRSLLAGKRVLVLLDNARDTEQARPLLPGAAGCLAVVTSRTQLPALVAVEGAHPVVLDVLTDQEARQFLTRRLGWDRLAAAPDATEDIVTRCARLPLALAIVAARAAIHPHLPLAALAAELRDSQARFDTFTGTEVGTDLRAVFSWSYGALSVAAARLLRLLGLHPGPDITAPAAASLAGRPAAEIRQLLAELCHANLLAERVPGRFALHDLLRAYAAHLCQIDDTEAERQAATHRMLDHYLHTVHAAADLFNPFRYQAVVLAPPQPGVTPEDLRDHRQALALADAERATLRGCVDLAASGGWDTHAWQLAWSLAGFFSRTGHWHDWIAVQRVALEAVERLGDQSEQARAHRSLAAASHRLGLLDDAHIHLRQALRLYRHLGDRVGEGYTHNSLGFLFETSHRYGDALGHARQALDLLRAADHAPGVALALNAVGLCHARVGNYQEAFTHCRQAIDLQRELGDQFGEATSWDSLGYAHHGLGQHEQAIACYQHAIALREDRGDRVGTAQTLTRLGDTHRDSGDEQAARRAWRRAAAIFDEMDHPDSNAVRAKLNQLGTAPA